MTKDHTGDKDSAPNANAGDDREPATRPRIVAIGASAGGLEALEELFDAMPEDPGIAFVLIQHLSPDHESLTPSLLARHTRMPATAVTERTPIEADRLYIIAPDTLLTLHDNHLEVDPRNKDASHWRPIDRCFASLAEARGADAVAVILSGTGSDGTDGARAIKARGGLVIAQNPGGAGFSGMIESAIDAGVVDHVLPVEEIPARITDHRTQRTRRSETPRSPLEHDVEAHLPDLLALVKTRAQYNLTGYKPGTPIRRIARRMEMNNIRRATDYLEHLKTRPDEIQQLVEDLFIGVTRFFRNPGAYECLGDRVIAPLIEEKPTGQSLRLWVAGCATGEEAYSLAILIAEHLEAANKRLNARILATDINERALEFGRHGRYNEAAVAGVSHKRLQRYFKTRDDGYQIRSDLREWVTFAKQDLLSDPAFAKLDLISCRNVLIYLDTSIQRRVLIMLHRALNPGGYLWLGQSETVGAQQTHFEPVSPGWRIYQRIGESPPQVPVREADARGAFATREKKAAPLPRTRSRAAPIDDAARHSLLEHYAPASVVVDHQYRILHFQGNTRPYLNFPSGDATLHLISMARRGLARKVRRATRDAYQRGDAVSARAILEDNGTRQPVLITARPLRGHDVPDDLLLVSFLDLETPEGSAEEPPEDEPLVRQLEYELQATQQELQGYIQHLEDTSEAANAMNEELQAANEELEASKEELQALNEEQRTVNTDLQEKNEELQAVRDDWRNLLVSTDIATVFLDRELNIRQFTPAVKRLFHLIESDEGRPLSHIVSRFGDGEALASDAQKVIATLTPSEREIRSSDGRWYERRILPYRTVDDTVNGVVATFIDVTERKGAEIRVEAARAYAEHILDTLSEAVLVLDAELRVLSANRAFFTAFATCREETEDVRVYELGNGQWDIPRLRTLLADILAHNTTFDDYEVTQDFPNVGKRVMLLNARRLDDVEDTTRARILLAMTDITEQKREAERSLSQLTYHAAHDPLTGLINRREFEQRLEQAIESARREDRTHVLGFIDLDQFKIVNDTAGHLAGDAVLRQIAELLRARVREADTIARLGGDEFGLLLEHCDIDEAQPLAEQLLESLAQQRFADQGDAFPVGMSIGLTVINAATRDATQALQEADAACYQAKIDGRHRSYVYRSQDAALSHRHGEFEWVGQVARALENQQLRLVCQPIVPTGDAPAWAEDAQPDVYRYELLLRLIDESGRCVPAAEFMPAAERYGLASRVDQWVVRHAFDWLREHPAHVERLALCSLNLSAPSLNDEQCLVLLHERLTDGSVAAHKICLEITETASIHSLDGARSAMEKLQALGCRFALDDFGSGLTSFHYLKVLPVDFLKIDGVIVQRVADNAIDRAMVESLNEIAHLMGKQTVAEGVHNQRVLDTLGEIGVDFVQGHALSTPRPLGDLT